MIVEQQNYGVPVQLIIIEYENMKYELTMIYVTAMVGPGVYLVAYLYMIVMRFLNLSL